ncbi:hypothetical protein DVT68_00155 [Dyella solisilvae]|uniref:Uncharacterized protein n=1 Tax=Dyella solisilvae TaxID=1920168 RepID=A0A370K9L4_9GAMM|nr:hypothetical protein [Dyella solisilvae]RDI99315.1 hypothetical protein DVT68_00155 [Dyella solisilvae]
MTDRKLRFRQALARITRVREQQAAASLAHAAAVVKQCEEARGQAMDVRNAVERERGRCLDADAGLDMARYALLGTMHEACEKRVDLATDAWETADAVRLACGETHLHARHRWERANEEAAQYRSDLAAQLHQKRMEDGIELWLQGRERA